VITLPEEPRSASIPKRINDKQIRKISFDDFQSTADKLFGVFNLEEYKVIRGFIPGKGKLVRLHYTKFEPTCKKASICIIHGYGEQSDDYLEVINT
jgi:acylglycerol lipase